MANMMIRLPKHATFFWDPLDPIPIDENRDMVGSTVRKATKPSITYEEHIRQNPPRIGMNHYKGDMVYGNFGYFLVGDKWVDPESEGALHNAYMNGSCEEDPNLPDFQRFRTSGPHIMNPQEEDKFYQGYVDDVTDDKDGEGDPRCLRISPTTFARWASGAAKGDRYEEAVPKPPVRLPCFRWISIATTTYLQPDRQASPPQRQMGVSSQRSAHSCSSILRRVVFFLAFTSLTKVPASCMLLKVCAVPLYLKNAFANMSRRGYHQTTSQLRLQLPTSCTQA